MSTTSFSPLYNSISAEEEFNQQITQSLTATGQVLSSEFKSLGIDSNTASVGTQNALTDAFSQAQSLPGFSDSGSVSGPVFDTGTTFSTTTSALGDIPTASSATGGGLTGALNGLNDALGNLLGKMSPESIAGNAVKSLFGLSLAQIAALIIGIGLILGGIFFLRPVQQATTTVIKAGRKGAELLAA